MNLKSIEAKDFKENIFKILDEDWLLVSAQKNGRVNPMTIAWGQMGMLWNKPVFIVAIRPERFTDSYLKDSDNFSISGFNEEYKEVLTYCGKNSGRDKDKIRETGLSLKYKDSFPYYEEAKFTILCKKIALMELKEENILEDALVEKWYSKNSSHGGGYHNIYIGEIKEILLKK